MADPADADPADADPAEAGRPGPDRGRRRRRRRALAETAIMILVAVLLAGLVRTFAFQTFWIPSSSMVPTLGVYDRILVQKAFFTWHDVREGDIVVFSHPPLDDCPGPRRRPGQARHRAAGADDLLVRQRHLRERAAAGRALPAARRPARAADNASSQHPYRVPPGEFYLLGDNRADSCDSRYWGPIKGSSIVGKVVLVWWHDNHPDFRRF